MATFTLNWTPNIDGNVTGQRAYKRQKSVGGSYITTGFLPANDLTNSANTTTAQSLLDNTVYEFQIANLCTVGGPVFNSNGVQEGITFACIAFTSTSNTNTAITVNYSGLPVDITKVEFTLFAADGTTIVQAATTNVVSGNATTKTYSGLTASTAYQVGASLIAVVNGAEKKANICKTTITTAAAVSCIAPTNLIGGCENCFLT